MLTVRAIPCLKGEGLVKARRFWNRSRAAGAASTSPIQESFQVFPVATPWDGCTRRRREHYRMVRQAFLSIVAVILVAQACALRVPDASRSGFRGALLRSSSDQIVQPSSPGLLRLTLLSFDIEDNDTDGFHGPGSPTRIVIPRGVSKVKLKASCVWQQNRVGMRQLVIKKNGGFFNGGSMANVLANEQTTTDLQNVTAVINVVPGDYFEYEVLHTADAPITVRSATGTWFSLEVVE
jgi:hypothetical protein